LPTTSETVERLPHSAELLTGRLAEYRELRRSMAEHHGLLVVTADPWSGTSALLQSAVDELDQPAIIVDARRCRDALDLALVIADRAVSEFVPEAEAWWTRAGPPTDAAGLRLARALAANGVDVEGFRLGAGEGIRRLREAIEVLLSVSHRAMLTIDHLGPMLSALPRRDATELLGSLRASRQEHSQLDLVLVEYPEGPISAAQADVGHPLYRAATVLRIRRALPTRFVRDFAITRDWAKDVRVDLLGSAAELGCGVPALVWRIIELAPDKPEFAPGRAFEGWRKLRRLTGPTTARQWDLLRRVHPLAQPIVAAMCVGMHPHAIGANSKSVNEGLKRLREVGMAWRTEKRYWAFADPLLAAWVRDHAPPWAARRSQRGSNASVIGRDD
jgi:hypothetical protein